LTDHEPPPKPTVTVPAPIGISLAYEVASQKLSAQLDQIDKLDSKAGAVVGALAAGIGLFLVAGFSVVARALIGTGLALGIVLAGQAFLVGKYRDAPNAETFATFAGYSPDRMKQIFLPNLLEALRENAVKLSRKGRYLNGSLAAITGLALLLVIAKVLGMS